MEPFSQKEKGRKRRKQKRSFGKTREKEAIGESRDGAERGGTTDEA